MSFTRGFHDYDKNKERFSITDKFIVLVPKDLRLTKNDILPCRCISFFFYFIVRSFVMQILRRSFLQEKRITFTWDPIEAITSATLSFPTIWNTSLKSPKTITFGILLNQKRELKQYPSGFVTPLTIKPLRNEAKPNRNQVSRIMSSRQHLFPKCIPWFR